MNKRIFILLSGAVVWLTAIRPVHAAPAGDALPLPPVTPRTITVIDAQGKTLPDVFITFIKQRAPRPAAQTARFGMGDGRGLMIVSRKKSDSRGVVTIPDLVGGDFIALAWAPNMRVAPLAISASQPLAAATITLLPIDPVRVRFVDGQGAPIAGVHLELLRAYAPNLPATGFDASTLAGAEVNRPGSISPSGPDGRVNVPAIDDGEILSLNVTAPGYQQIMLTMSSPADDGLIVRLVPGATITGRLVGADEKTPLADQALQIQNEQSHLNTDLAGNFTSTELDENTMVLHLDNPDLVIPPLAFATHRGKTTDLGTVVASPGCSLSGFVGFSSALPSARSTVTAILDPAFLTSPELAGWYESTMIDETGHYHLRLPPGRFVIMARSGEAFAQPQFTAIEGATATLDLIFTRHDSRLAPTKSPAPIDTVDFITGRVLDADSAAPLGGATVHAYFADDTSLEATCNDQGQFAFAGIDIKKQLPDTSVIVAATVQGMVSEAVRADLSSDRPVTIHIAKESILTVRVVGTDGRPVAGAEINATTFSVPVPQQSWWRPRDLSGMFGDAAQRAPAITDGNGIGILHDVPLGVFAQLGVHRDGFADGIYTVALPRRDTVKLRLSRETVIEGRLLLADGRPVNGTGAAVHLRSAASTWSQYSQGFSSPIDAKGNFKVSNVPSLDMMEQPSVSLNIELPDMGAEMAIGEDATMQYAPPSRGSNIHLTDTPIAFGGGMLVMPRGDNILLTLNVDGRQEHWIAYHSSQHPGIVFQEGEHVRRDIVFQPMADIMGKVSPIDKSSDATNSVSYHDPNSSSFDWSVACDAEGNFELPVPVGDVTLEFSVGGRITGRQTVTGLKAQEIRAVEFKADSFNASRGRSAYSQLFLRVLGPDGATVPRPPISWQWPTGARGSTFESSMGAMAQMDGSVQIWSMEGRSTGGQGNHPSIEFTSPYLDQPVRLTADNDGRLPPLRFDRNPPQVAGVPVSMRGQSIRPVEPLTQELAPKAEQVGAIAPELNASLWLRHGPIKLSEQLGKIVVLQNGNEFSLRSQLDRLAPWAKNPSVVIIGLLARLNPGTGAPLNGDIAAGATTAGPTTADSVPIAEEPLVIDPQLALGRGFNSAHFGIPSEGAAIIGRDGRIAAVGLTGPYFTAKLEQLLANSGP